MAPSYFINIFGDSIVELIVAILLSLFRKFYLCSFTYEFEYLIGSYIHTLTGDAELFLNFSGFPNLYFETKFDLEEKDSIYVH